MNGVGTEPICALSPLSHVTAITLPLSTACASQLCTHVPALAWAVVQGGAALQAGRLYFRSEPLVRGIHQDPWHAARSPLPPQEVSQLTRSQCREAVRCMQSTSTCTASLPAGGSSHCMEAPCCTSTSTASSWCLGVGWRCWAQQRSGRCACASCPAQRPGCASPPAAPSQSP